MGIIKKTVLSIGQYLDVRMGLLGAISLAGIVYWINIDHGLFSAGIAAVKQALYTFFFGGLFLRMAENISTQREDRLKAILSGGLIPAFLTTLLTYCLHAFKGTPEPFHSTIPTLIMSTLSFSIWSFLKHRETYSNNLDA